MRLSDQKRENDQVTVVLKTILAMQAVEIASRTPVSNTLVEIFSIF